MPKVSLRWARWVAPLIAAIYAGIAVFAFTEDDWRSEWDSASYMLTARSIAEGSGYRYQGEPFFLRPPGFSFALSFLIGSEGEIDFELLNRLVALSAALALLTIALALQATLGRSWALVASVVVMTSPVLIGYLNWIQADLPYLAVFYLALWLLDERRDPEKPGLTRILVGTLALAGAAHLRTVALLLIPGIALIALTANSRPTRRRLILGAVATTALCLPWLLEARELAREATRPSEQLMLFDYWTAMFHVDPGDPASAYVGWNGWAQRFSDNANGLYRDISMGAVGATAGAATFLFLACATLGFISRVWRTFSLLEWHFATYLLLMSTYFAQDLRLLLPLLPALYAYVLIGAREASQWVARRMQRPRLAPVLPGLVAALLLVYNLESLPNALDAGSLGAETTSLDDQWDSHRRVASWLRDNTPPDARILAGNAPVLSLLADRDVYTFRFMRSPDIAKRYAIDYVIFYPGTPKVFVQNISTSGATLSKIPLYRGNAFARVYKLPPGN